MPKYRGGVSFVMDELAHCTRLDRNQRVKIMHAIETMEVRTKRAGCRNGVVGKPAVEVLRALLFRFHNVATGRCTPSYEALKRETGLCRASIAKALVILSSMGVLKITRRIVRVVNDFGQVICRQGSNIYGFGAIGRFIQLPSLPAAKPRVFKRVHGVVRNTNTVANNADLSALNRLEVGFSMKGAAIFGTGHQTWRDAARASITKPYQSYATR